MEAGDPNYLTSFQMQNKYGWMKCHLNKPYFQEAMFLYGSREEHNTYILKEKYCLFQLFGK